MASLSGELLDRFNAWMTEAEAGEPHDANAMALATATPEGAPSVRMVLLKSVDAEGFVFYSNEESRKGLELAANPHVSLLFYWKSLRRQIRVEGPVERVSDAEADAYFASRARLSRIGAWASQQSRAMTGRFEFEAAIAKYTAKFGLGTVPRPPYWGGWRVLPEHLEFWQDRRNRLHERDVYHWNAAVGDWQHQVLYP